MQLPLNKKIYFVSDLHLGVPHVAGSLAREKIFLQFLEEVKNDAHTIFIVGDLFDFWYEYKKVVPKGYVRLLGKLAELTDAGIAIHFFVGNHDMWMRNYFPKELNIPVYYKPHDFEFNGKKFLIGHGDGLGPGDKKYKFLKKIFRNPVCQWMFGILPSSVGIGMAQYFSNKSRNGEKENEKTFLGEDKEWLIIHSKEILSQQHYHFFVFGHRHLPINFRLSNDSWYVNLGDWINYYTYAVFDGAKLDLKSFTGKNDKIIKNY